ncbi:MAG TPA: hypothetical protein VGO43_12215 [Pyrinomonadaceae bacterium]|jgi:hypothetical protein|nr:hypothetical protein [Pyrinomonadaceae bacterium]
MTFVVLLDRKAPARNDVKNWLANNGYVAWLAKDLCHAIEELSDFTVRKRPDVVLLEVAFLSESCEALQSTLDSSSGRREITVLGLTDGSSDTKQHFASNFDQLCGLIDRERTYSLGF